jgi:hypothetical protein
MAADDGLAVPIPHLEEQWAMQEGDDREAVLPRSW